MAIDEDALHLVEMLDEIMERIVGIYEQAGVPLPDRRYWTMGTPAADCEQLVISFRQAYVGPVGDEANEPQRCNSPRTAQLDIQVLRKVAIVGQRNGRGNMLPTAEAIQETSRLQLIDAYLLLDAAASLDTWDEDVYGSGMGVIATVDAGEAEGQYLGPTLHLTVAIP